MRILHAIHDFLPRHRAGSEIYAARLARTQAERHHHVTVVCAEYDPQRVHGDITWRLHDGISVAEIVNNWSATTFKDTYCPPLVTDRLREVLRAVQPEILHVHNLLNLSFDLPSVAKSLGIPVVATLHDYTLVCTSGGQRVHRADAHVCTTIDPERCARCFVQSPFHSMMHLAGLVSAAPRGSLIGRAARQIASRFPGLVRGAASVLSRSASPTVTATDIEDRLSAAARVFEDVDIFVAPSPSLAKEYRALGVNPAKLQVSDYGFVPLRVLRKAVDSGPLRIGFVGTLVWHKGVHVLIDAVRRLPIDAYRLAIHGDLDVFPEYVRDLRQQASGLPVEFKGAFTHEVAQVYDEMDVLVVPSLWPENSPLVIHEAFMAGIPIVGARSGGIADLVTHGVNGLLYDAYEPSALSAALAELAADRRRVHELASRIPPVKSIDQDAAEWDAVYAGLVACRVAS